MYLETIADKRRVKFLLDLYGPEPLNRLNKQISSVIPRLNRGFGDTLRFIHSLDSFDKSTISKLPQYSIEGRKVLLVRKKNDLDAAISDIKKSKVLGFDTEQKPVFKKNQRQSKIQILQIAAKNSCYLFHLPSIHSLNQIKSILESDKIVKVGFGLENDVGELSRQYDIKVKAMIDLGRTVTKGLSLAQPIGTKKAVAIFLKKNMRKAKKVALSNWAKQPLSREQIVYAAEDAFASLDVMKKIFTEYEYLRSCFPVWFQNKWRSWYFG